MARFIYKMQNILNIKYKLENQAKIEYANASAKLRAEEEKLAEIYRVIEIYQDKIRGQNGQVLVINELQYCTQAIEYKKMQAEVQKKQIKIAERNLEKARAALNAIMIDRKTHESLRDKEFEKFKMEINAEEKKEIDELVSFQYNDRK